MNPRDAFYVITIALYTIETFVDIIVNVRPTQPPILSGTGIDYAPKARRCFAAGEDGSFLAPNVICSTNSICKPCDSCMTFKVIQGHRTDALCFLAATSGVFGLEWKQTARRTDTTEFITFLANAVGDHRGGGHLNEIGTNRKYRGP